MEKQVLGNWGSDLNDAAYGRALAALGALEASGTHQHSAAGDDPAALAAALHEEFAGGDRTVVWRGAYGSGCIGARKTIYRQPLALAEAWERYLNFDHPRYRPRLAVPAAPSRPCAEPIDRAALFGWLSRRDVHCQALMVAPLQRPAAGTRTAWHWPLRVGFPAGPEGEALLAAVRGRGPQWLVELGHPFLVGAGRDPCDLLVVPPGMAGALTEGAPLRIRASFIAVMDEPVGAGDVPGPAHTALMAAVGASGLALVGRFDAHHVALWYEELIREISHDLPVHAAIWGIGVYRSGVLPTIFGLPKALDRLRILAIAERLDRTYASLSPQPTSPLEGAKGLFPAPELVDYVRTRPFSAESVDGIPVAQRIAEREAAIGEAAPPRWLQARMWAREPAPREPSAMEDGASLLAIHIGPSRARRTDAAFPDRYLDFEAGEVRVTVQVEAVGAQLAPLAEDVRRAYPERGSELGPAPERIAEDFLHGALRPSAVPEPVEAGAPVVTLASTEISLPPTGDSEVAYFALWPAPGGDKISGRVAVVHGNRVIQTAVLAVPVGGGVIKTAELAFRTEDVVHSGTDDLEERRVFDAALIAADDFGSQLRLTVNHDGTATEVFLSGVQEPIAKIRRIVEQGANRLPDTLPLDDERMRRVLRSLVSHGKLLYDDLKAALGKSVDDFTRIQLITRGTAFFPVEYVYDGPALELSATVCDDAPTALVRGSCDDCSHKEARDTICPLHFWGFTRVIERHAGDDVEGAARPAGVPAAGTAAQRPLPSPTRTPFGAVRPVLFAASDRAFNFTDGAAWRTRLVDALHRLGDGAQPGEARTWDAWRAMIGAAGPRPKVLVLLPHATPARELFDVDALEIGAAAQLAKDQIGPDIIGDVEAPQLLLLLGCSTADVTEIFAPYPRLFRRAGADVIIASIAPIRGADAAPIAERIADLLTDQLSQGKEVAFGELLLDVRRQLLAGGHPGVLGLVGFGDGDWRFGGTYAEA